MLDLNSELASRIRRNVVSTSSKYSLIEAGDKIMVAVSGGKDSSILLATLQEIQRRSPFDFSITPVILDQKQPGFDVSNFRTWVEDQLGIPLTVLEQDTYSIVLEKSDSKVFCGLCSRLRRGILYEHAHRHGFTKIALGHHKNDSIETLLMNLFYSGKMQAMPPKFLSDDKRNIVIRPLIDVAEEDLKSLSKDWQMPIIPCNLCGSQDGLKRQRIKRLVSDLKKEIPDIENSIVGAIGNIKLSHLADDSLWKFNDLLNDKIINLQYTNHLQH